MPAGMPTDRDIHTSANVLLQTRGLDGARAYAQERIRDLAHDADGEATWILIAQAIEHITRATARADSLIRRRGRAGAERWAQAQAEQAERRERWADLAEWSLVLDRVRAGRG